MASRSFSERSRYHHGSCRTRYRRAYSQGLLGFKSNSKNVSSVSLTDNSQELSFNSAINESVQSEEKYIKELEQLLMLLHHPGLQGNVLSLHEFIQNVSDLMSVHKNLKDDLTRNMCSVACAFFNFMPYMNFYLDYCRYLRRIHHSLEKVIDQCEKELFSKCAALLQAPILHITNYNVMLTKLQDSVPEYEKTPLKEIQDAVNKTVMEMTNICKSTENMLKLLWIQKCLVDRQPKIFLPGRVLLKNGTLYKIKSFGRGLAERVLLLFNDILLCCKKVKKCDDSYKRSSLKCCAVIPIPDCSIVMIKEPENKIEYPMLKITWCNNNYCLFSKTLVDAQTWLEVIQETVRFFKESFVEKQAGKKNVATSIKRAAVIHKKSQYHSSDNLSIGSYRRERPPMIRQNCIVLSDSQQLSET